MGKQFNALTPEHLHFIEQQNIFFVGTATHDSRVNISPKGMDSLRIINPHRALWLNVTGSGNESAAHVKQQPRMTLMFCALSGAPMIMRLYGQAKVIHPHDQHWAEFFAHFNPLPGARQIFDLHIDLVQTSCGMAVPYFDYKGERDELQQWAIKKGDVGVKNYWREKNQTSIDGLPTHIIPTKDNELS